MFSRGTLETVSTPAADQDAGLLRTSASVVLSDATSGASMHYTIDGATPTCSTGTVYTGPVTIASNLTLKAIGCKTSYADSGLLSLAFTTRDPIVRYVKAGGSNSSDGASDGTAWVAMPGMTGCTANCAAVTPVGGDKYLFNKGDGWTGAAIIIGHAGDRGANIIIGTYGSGAKPSIAGIVNQPTIHATGVHRGYWTIDGLDLHATGQVQHMFGAITIFHDWFVGGVGSDTPQPGWIIQNIQTDGQVYLTGNAIMRNSLADGKLNHGTEQGNGTIGAATGAFIVSGSGSSGCQIYGNAVFNFTGRGVWISDGAHNCTVHDNIIHDIVSYDNPHTLWIGFGIDFDGAAIPEDGNIAYNNDIYTIYGQGISFENQTNAAAYQNRINNCRAYAVASVHYDGSYGSTPYLGVPAHNLVYNNVLSNSWRCGGPGDEAYTSWVHNTCMGGYNTWAHVTYQGTTDTYDGSPDRTGWASSGALTNMVFVDNIIAGYSCPVGAPASATWTQFDYNDLYGTGTTVFCNGSNRTLAQTQALGYMSHGIAADPLFTNASARDYTLQVPSPARQTGNVLASPFDEVLDPLTSFPWSLEPQGSQPNMGAFGPG
jgi:hypothetical protein